MTAAGDRYVYGPVPSRRLGRSLGVDLVPFKTCPYDCIYCQLGRTTNKTIDLAEYTPLDEVMAEVAGKLESGPRPDYVGLAGSGEPTLHSRLGDLISELKRMTDVPVAVLTNGALLWMPEVRANLADADLVLPSLDAGDPDTFRRVNRPHVEVTFERMVDGLTTFRRGFRGAVWLEVLLLGRITDRPQSVESIAAIARQIAPDRVQLNTVARPPAEDSALPVPYETLEELRDLFSGVCEIIADVPPGSSNQGSSQRGPAEDVLALLARRPCTVEGIATGLGMHPNEVVKHLDALRLSGAVRSSRRGDLVFYEAIHHA